MVAGNRRCCAGSIIGVIVVLGILGILFIYSGIYNVAANYPDTALAAWVFSTTMDHSVQHHAASIKTPALDDPAMVEAGFGHYRRMCAGCHGAPGIHKMARGFNPDPPELTEAAGDWKPNELFWIVKNGVRMSGMPAWGVSQSDDKIWEIVAFARKLPSMKPAEYQALNRKIPPMKMP